MILPYFDYCSMVWENCGNCALQRLQKMPNRAARLITGKSYEVRSSEILRDIYTEEYVIGHTNKILHE